MVRLTSVLVGLLLLLTAFSTPTIAAASSASVASSLSVNVVPPILPADGKVHSVVFLSVTDSNGNPTIPLSDITVYLSSSQQSVAVVQSPIVIPTGASYVVANATVTETPGTTTITASSNGLASVTAKIQTMIPAGFPTTVRVFASPNLQPPAVGLQGTLVVEILDQLGHPTRAASNTQVNLVSSNQGIAVPATGATVTILEGQTLASIGYTSDPSLPNTGTTTITALASGLNAGYAEITVEGSPASPAYSLGLEAGPGELIADGRSYSALTVMLQSNASNPTVATSNVVVQLASSDPNVIQVPPVAAILAGHSFVTVNVTTTVASGGATITAAYPGLLSASVGITTVVLAPSRVAIYAAPSDLILSRSGGTVVLFAQLQDQSGNPGLARAAATVLIASSNSTLGKAPINVTIGKAENYVTVKVPLKGPVGVTLTASSSGLESSTTTLSSFVLPSSASISAESYTIASNSKDLLSVRVAALGVPLAGARVTWSSKAGTFNATQSVTNSKGLASVYFTPAGEGPALILAQVNDQVIGKANLSAGIFVTAPVVAKSPTILDTILHYQWYILIGAAAAVVVVVVALVLRRRRKRREGEAEEALSEDTGSSF